MKIRNLLALVIPLISVSLNSAEAAPVVIPQSVTFYHNSTLLMAGFEFNGAEMAHMDSIAAELGAISPGFLDNYNDWKANGGKIAHLEGGLAKDEGAGACQDGDNIYIDTGSLEGTPTVDPITIRVILHYELGHILHGTNGVYTSCEHAAAYQRDFAILMEFFHQTGAPPCDNMRKVNKKFDYWKLRCCFLNPGDAVCSQSNFLPIGC